MRITKRLDIRVGVLLPFLVLASQWAGAQKIIIYGKVKTAGDMTALYSLMIVNKQTNQGQFGAADGHFSMEAQKTDTLLIGAVGFSTMQLTFADSALKNEYHITLTLQPLRFQLHQVEVFAERDLADIEKEIQELGYNERDYQLSGASAFSSPITFLYQEFSRRERSKRKVMELENDDRRRKLLKELLAKYVHQDIIQLEDSEFDDFIDYCEITDVFMQKTHQYDFIMYIKMRYTMYADRQK